MLYTFLKKCIFLTAIFLFVVSASTGGSSELELAGLDGELGPEDAFTDETLAESDQVLFSGGSLLPLNRAPYVASVITAKDIEASGALLLSEVLEMVPGIHVGLTSYGRIEPAYSIRGIHTKFNSEVLILIDGQPMSSLAGSRPFAFRMPVKSIERVEVIRGPGSAIYGADAYSGVINVLTKDADAIDGTVVGGGLGSFDTNNVYLQHGKAYGNIDVAFSFEWLGTDGDDGRRINTDTQTSLDGIFGTSVSNAPGSLSTEFNLLDIHLDLAYRDWDLHYQFMQNREVGLGAGLALALDPEGSEDLKQQAINLGYSKQLGHWETDLDFYYNRNEGESSFGLFPAGAVLPIDDQGNINFVSPRGVTYFPDGVIGEPSGNLSLYKADLTTVYSGFSDQRLRLAAGYSHQELEAGESKNFGPGALDGTQMVADGTLVNVSNTEFVFLPNVDRKLWYASIQDEWFFTKGWSLTAGVRYDDYSDFGETFNPRLALVWEASDDLTAKMLYGRAFRAPTFTETYTQNNPSALGNKDVDPETIDTAELAFIYRPLFNLQANLNVFVYKAKDLIEFLPSATGVIMAQNARDQDGYGGEIEVDWQLIDNLRLRTNLGYQQSEDNDTGADTPMAPKWSGFAQIDWEPVPHWQISPNVAWVADRPRAKNDPRPEIEDYALVNLVVKRRNLFDRVDASFTVKNIFDTTAYEPSAAATINDDFPLAGLSVFAELAYRF